MGSWSKGTDYVYDPHDNAPVRTPDHTPPQPIAPTLSTVMSMLAKGVPVGDVAKQAVVRKAVKLVVVISILFTLIPFVLLAIGIGTMINENGVRVVNTSEGTIYTSETPKTAPLLTDYFTLPEDLRLDYKVSPNGALTRQSSVLTTYTSKDTTELTQFSYEQLPSGPEFATNEERSKARLEWVRTIELAARNNAYEQPLQTTGPTTAWVPVAASDQKIQVLMADYTYSQGMQKRHAGVVMFVDTLAVVYGIYDIPQAGWTSSTMNDFVTSLHFVTK